MKSTGVALAALVMIVMVGCNKGTEGGPGATKPGNKPIVGQPEEAFSLTVPMTSTKIKQGESKEITIGIKRGKNFDQDVTLKFEGEHKGVAFEPAGPVLKHGETESKIMAKAADDAAVGDFTVKVIGHPATGVDATNDLKITVEKK
jgi:hypothetical protein